MSAAAGRVLQPSDLFQLAKISNTEEAEKLLGHILSFLAYIKPGDVLETSTLRFTKLGHDLIEVTRDDGESELIHVDVHATGEMVVDSLAKRKVLRFPV